MGGWRNNYPLHPPPVHPHTLQPDGVSLSEQPPAIFSRPRGLILSHECVMF